MIAAFTVLGTDHPLGAQSEGRDLSKLKGEMRVFSAVVDESMAQTFSPPFGILQKTKGAYLPDFGVVFTLEVNLYPVPLQKLLQSRPSSKSEQERELKAKKGRILTIRQMVPRLLADHARALRDVEDEESIAVAVQLFFVQTDQEELPSQVVVEVRKSALEKYWEQKLTYEQLMNQVKIAEF